MAKNGKHEAVAKVEPAGLPVLPENLKKYMGAGYEGMTREDLQTPRLSLAQGLSPQISPDDPAYIEGLKLGDAFNSVTKQVYGRGPWSMAVVRRDPPRWIEFIPREMGGGIKDFNVPVNDPRTQFWNDSTTGERKPPIATKFYDFVVVFLDTLEPVALSFKSKGISVAKSFNTLISLRRLDIGGSVERPPIFMGKYLVSTFMDKAPKGTFTNLHIVNDGWVTDPALLTFLAKTFEEFKDKELKIEREPGSDDDMPEM